MDRIETAQLRAWNNDLPAGGDLILIIGRAPAAEVGGDVWWDYVQDGIRMSAPEGVLLDRSYPQ